MLPGFIYYPTTLGTEIGPATLDGYTLRQDEGSLYLCESPGSQVQGAVYQMPESDWQKIGETLSVTPSFWGEKIQADAPIKIDNFSRQELRGFLGSIGKKKWKYPEL